MKWQELLSSLCDADFSQLESAVFYERKARIEVLLPSLPPLNDAELELMSQGKRAECIMNYRNRITVNYQKIDLRTAKEKVDLYKGQ